MHKCFKSQVIFHSGNGLALNRNKFPWNFNHNIEILSRKCIWKFVCKCWPFRSDHHYSKTGNQGFTCRAITPSHQSVCLPLPKARHCETGKMTAHKFVHLHFLLTLLVLKPEYYLRRSIAWLLMPWLLVSPGHQQPYYWLHRRIKSLSSQFHEDGFQLPVSF